MVYISHKGRGGSSCCREGPHLYITAVNPAAPRNEERRHSMRRAAALLLMAAASLAASAPFTPIARVTWSHPNGPGLLLGADPRKLGLGVGVTEFGPFVAVQGEWEAGRVDVGVRSSIDLLIPVAGFAASGSIMKRWDSESTYAGARVWAGKSLLTVSCGLYQRFRGEEGEEWLVTAGVGLGTL